MGILALGNKYEENNDINLGPSYLNGWFHPGQRMTAKKRPYFFLRQNSNLNKYKYWRVPANL